MSRARIEPCKDDDHAGGCRWHFVSAVGKLYQHATRRAADADFQAEASRLFDEQRRKLYGLGALERGDA